MHTFPTHLLALLVADAASVKKGLKIVAVVVVVALLASVLATVVLAQGPRGGSAPQTNGAWSGCPMNGAGYSRSTFVDDEGDGVCDASGEGCPIASR